MIAFFKDLFGKNDKPKTNEEKINPCAPLRSMTPGRPTKNKTSDSSGSVVTSHSDSGVSCSGGDAGGC
tara:strand:- start:968 stop:1171 length:204 start_codon:yes stop_codon:yes gene_type:complete